MGWAAAQPQMILYDLSHVDDLPAAKEGRRTFCGGPDYRFGDPCSRGNAVPIDLPRYGSTYDMWSC